MALFGTRRGSLENILQLTVKPTSLGCDGPGRGDARVWNMIMKQCCEATTTARPVADPTHLALVLGWRELAIVSSWWTLWWKETIVGDLRGGVGEKCGWTVRASGGHCLVEVITAQPAWHPRVTGFLCNLWPLIWKVPGWVVVACWFRRRQNQTSQ